MAFRFAAKRKNIHHLRSLFLFLYSPFGTFILALIALAVYLFIMLRSAFPEPSISREVYFAGDISYAHQQVINEFNKKFEGRIKVIPIDLSFKEFTTNDRKELIARALRSKSDKFDLFAVDQIWVKRFAKWSEPLNNYIRTDQLKNMLTEPLISCYSNDSLVAFPINIDVGMMYYRKDLLEKLKNYNSIKTQLDSSITWTDFIKLGKKLNSKEHPFYIFPADNYEGLVCSYVELALTSSPDIFNRTNKINLLTQGSVDALQMLVNLVQTYKISPRNVLDFDETASFEYFITNNGYFLRGWPSYEKDKKNLFNYPGKEDELGYSPLPRLKGFPSRAILGGWNIMLSKSSRNKQAAIEFLKFVISKQAQQILYTKGGYLPILTSFYSDTTYPKLKFFKKLIDNGVHRPFLENYTSISDILAYYSHKAINGDLTVYQALSQANAMINSGKILIK
ncbi:MAG: extracellular solute-binding protein [Bacteroidetes bacterium]|nr:extracellular solute-binding protein [Bacteroidota bacterium]